LFLFSFVLYAVGAVTNKTVQKQAHVCFVNKLV